MRRKLFLALWTILVPVCCLAVDNDYHHAHSVRIESSGVDRHTASVPFTFGPFAGTHSGQPVGANQYQYDAFSGTLPAVTQMTTEGLPNGFSMTIEWDSFDFDYAGETLTKLTHPTGEPQINVIDGIVHEIYGPVGDTFTFSNVSGEVTVTGPTEMMTQVFDLSTEQMLETFGRDTYNLVNLVDDSPFVVAQGTARVGNSADSGLLFAGTVDETFITVYHNFSGAISDVHASEPTATVLALLGLFCVPLGCLRK